MVDRQRVVIDSSFYGSDCAGVDLQRLRFGIVLLQNRRNARDSLRLNFFLVFQVKGDFLNQIQVSFGINGVFRRQQNDDFLTVPEIFGNLIVVEIVGVLRRQNRRNT